MITTGIDKRVKVQQIIENQIPEFLISESPKAVDFLKQYYISQEYQGGPIDLTDNLDQYLKLDNLTPEVIVGETVLTSGITTTDTTVNVSSTKGFPNEYGLFKIESEVVTYTGVTTNSFTGCIRGFSGITTFHAENNPSELIFSDSDAINHDNGSTVQNLSALFLKEFYKKTKKLLTPGLENVNFIDNLDVSNVENVQKVISKFGLAVETVNNQQRVKMETIEAKPAEIAPDERGLEDIKLDFATPAEAVIPNLEGLGEVKEDFESTEDELHKTDVSLEEQDVSVDVQEDLKVHSDLPKSNEKVIAETVETEETILHLDEEGTIVAPKVELEGITVKGKIDIPGVTDQTEKLEEEVLLTPEQEAENKEIEEKRLEEEARKEEARRKKIDEDAARAAAYKARKENEAKEALKAKIAEEKKKKREEGREYYLNSVKQVSPGQKNKKKKTKASLEAEDNKAFESNEKYAKTENMTTWQKIVRWFNT